MSDQFQYRKGDWHEFSMAREDKSFSLSAEGTGQIVAIRGFNSNTVREYLMRPLNTHGMDVWVKEADIKTRVDAPLGASKEFHPDKE